MELPSNRVRPFRLYKIVANVVRRLFRKITSARGAVIARGVCVRRPDGLPKFYPNREMVEHWRKPAVAVVVLLCSLACFGPANDLQAGTLLSPGAAALIGKSAEPFGLIAYPHSFGSLNEKWRAVERRLDDERVQIALGYRSRFERQRPRALRLSCRIAISRHRRCCQRARWPRPSRRNQPRHQSRNPPDERSCPIR